MKTIHRKQPENLKRVKVNGHLIYFSMNVTKKRMHELLSNPEFEEHKRYKGYISPVKIETNSVWYDINGNCVIAED